LLHKHGENKRILPHIFDHFASREILDVGKALGDLSRDVGTIVSVKVENSVPGHDFMKGSIEHPRSTHLEELEAIDQAMHEHFLENIVKVTGSVSRNVAIEH
jgi:hypothetical protein